MPRTLQAINDTVRQHRWVRGATLIEMTIVIFVLLIIAAAVLPRVVAAQQSESIKQLEAKIARLPAEAQNQAVALQTPVRIRISSDSIVMEKVGLSADGGISTNSESDQIKEIDLGDSIKADNAQLNGKTSQPDSWQWVVYPDGTSDKGALEFEVDRSHYSLVITDHAASQWISGDMPDQTQDLWPAGEMVQRT